MTDQSDPVAVLREFFRLLDEAHSGSKREPTESERRCAESMPAALAELERRQGREKRLEALVRRLAETEDHIAFAYLSEAARKELENG